MSVTHTFFADAQNDKTQFRMTSKCSPFILHSRQPLLCSWTNMLESMASDLGRWLLTAEDRSIAHGKLVEAGRSPPENRLDDR